MKVPVIYFIDESIYEFLIKKKINIEDELYIGFFMFDGLKIYTKPQNHKKIFIESNFYKVIQKKARECNLYTGIVVGEMIAFRIRNGLL